MVTTNERSPIAASIRAVAATCAQAPSIDPRPKNQPGLRHRRVRRYEFADKKNQYERQAEQKPHMRGADRAEARRQLALHGIAERLSEGGDDSEDGPQPGRDHYAAFSATIM